MTEKSVVLEQYTMLKKTSACLQMQSDAIKDFFGISGFYSVTFLGRGSMSDLCRSAELSLRMRGGMTAMSLSIGDLMVNIDKYIDMLNGSMIMVSSQESNDDEFHTALTEAKNNAGATVISCVTSEKSILNDIADLSISLPWAEKNSFTDAHSLTNLYFANIFNIALLSGDIKLLDEIKTMANDMEILMGVQTDTIQCIAADKSWESVLILSDGELAGVGRSGATILRSLGKVPARHCHTLDLGYDAFPDDKTLVIAVAPLHDEHKALSVIREHGSKLVTISPDTNHDIGSVHIPLPNISNAGALGIPALVYLQMLACFRRS